MAANGYGYGNLPMDLYKMVTHDIWDYNGRANGQGDYREWGIRRIAITIDGETDGGFYWWVDGGPEPCDLVGEMDGDDWYWYD